MFWRLDLAVSVCVANCISGRQQKPVGKREQVPTYLISRNPLPLGRGGCQSWYRFFAIAKNIPEEEFQKAERNWHQIYTYTVDVCLKFLKSKGC